MDPAGGSDEPGVVAAAVPEALAPWERFVLGLDEALRGAGAAGRGWGDGFVPASRAARFDAGAAVPGEGGGSSPRSVPDRPADAEREGTDLPTPTARTEGIESVIGGFPRAWGTVPDRETRMEAVNAAIARFGTERAGIDLDADDPPARTRTDAPGLARCASPSPCWRPDRFALGAPTGRSGFARGQAHGSRSASRVRPQVAPRATGRPPRHVRERCHPLRSRPGAAPAPAVVGGTRGAGDDARYGRGRHKTVRSSPWSDRSQRGFSPCPIQRRPRSDAGSPPIDLSDGRGDVRTAAPSAGRSSDSGRSSN